MSTVWTIAKKEFRDYFTAPIAYIYLITFLAVTTWLFLRSFFLVGQGTLRGFFTLMPWIYLFFIPAIAMGKWSEEKKQGTIELLFTLPISKRDVLAGKFLAGLGLLTTALLCTFPLPLTLSFIAKLDWGPVIGGYLGLLFMGGAYLAIGLWISSLTRNQIVAFILGVAACFALFIIGEPLVTTGLPSLPASVLRYAGLGTHFESIGRGVIDSRDILYYFSVILLFLFFNLKVLEGRPWIPSLALLIGIITLNLLASRHFARLDLTRQKMYTLAPATKKILKNLDDVVTIRLYFTPHLPPALGNVRRDVEDILSEYKTYAGNRLRVEYHNPQADPAAEQKVQAMGIPPIELSVIHKDKQEVAKIYLGMTVGFASRQEILAVVQNTANLEYRLDAAILKVSQFQKPVLGWWGPTADYSFLMDRLKQRYDVKTWEAGAPTVLFIGSEGVTPEQKKGLADYLQKGGKAILLAETVSVSKEGLKASPRENPAAEILKEYGVEVGTELTLDRSSASATFTGGIINYHLPYPYWVKIAPAGFDPAQPMVSELSSLILPWPNPLHISEPLPEGVTATPIFQTTRFGTTAPVNPNVPLDPQATQAAMEQGVPRVITLGALLIKKGTEGAETQMVVVGDTAFAQNPFLELFEENVVFIENAVDVLSAGSELLGVRTKGMGQAPIAVLSEGDRMALRLINIFLSPILLLGLGALLFFRRRAKAGELKALYAS